MDIAKQDFIDNEIRNICYSITPVTSGLSVGYTLRKTGELLGDIYKIFVNSGLKPDVTQFVLDHEFGHVIFGHMNNDALNEALAISKMETSYDNYKHLFPDDATKEDAVNFAKGALLNIAMDCEVNSKLFTKDEYDHFEKEICGDDKDAHLIHPTNYDLPVEESYIYYINGLCDNPEKMIEDFFKEKDNQQNQNNQGQQGQRQGQSQSSNGNSQSSQQSQSNNQNNSGNKQSSSGNGNGNSNQNNSGDKQENSGSSNQNSGNEQKSSFDKNGKISKEAFEKAKKEIQESTAGTTMDNNNTSTEDGPGLGNENRELQVTENDTLEQVKKTVLKEIIHTAKTSKKDMMYNYNRRKNGSNVIVSKQISSVKKEIGKAYFIVDVSGSMSQCTLEKLYNTFTEIGKQINKESRIILWNGELVSDKRIFEKELKVGGGTRIADGIDYVSEKYLTRKDILFVCSDFEDDLDNWNIALSKAKYKRSYGILLGSQAIKKVNFDRIFRIDNV